MGFSRDQYLDPPQRRGPLSMSNRPGSDRPGSDRPGMGRPTHASLLAATLLVIGWLVPTPASGQSDENSFREFPLSDVPLPQELFRALLDSDPQISNQTGQDGIPRELLEALNELMKSEMSSDTREALEDLAEDFIREQQPSGGSGQLRQQAERFRRVLQQDPQLEQELRQQLGGLDSQELKQQLQQHLNEITQQPTGGPMTGGTSVENSNDGRTLPPPDGTNSNAGGNSLRNGDGSEDGPPSPFRGGSPGRPRPFGEVDRNGQRQQDDTPLIGDPNGDPLGNGGRTPPVRTEDPNSENEAGTGVQSDEGPEDIFAPRSNRNANGRGNSAFNSPNETPPGTGPNGSSPSERAATPNRQAEPPVPQERPNHVKPRGQESLRTRLNRVLYQAVIDSSKRIAEENSAGGQQSGSMAGSINNVFSKAVRSAQDHMNSADPQWRSRLNRRMRAATSDVKETSRNSALREVFGKKKVDTREIAASGNTVLPWIVVGCLVVGGGVLVYFFRRRLGDQVSRYFAVATRQKPFRLPSIRSGSDLVSALDAYVVSRFGTKAAWWHSRRVRYALAADEPHMTREIVEMMRCYEIARYAPETQSLDSQRIAGSHRTLGQLASRHTARLSAAAARPATDGTV